MPATMDDNDIICVSKNILGTDKHLTVLTKNFERTFVDEIPQNAWVLDKTFKNYRCLDTLALLSQVNFRYAPQVHDEIFNFVSSQKGEETPPWQSLLRPRTFELFLNELVTKCCELLAGKARSYYERTWVKRSTILNSLVEAKINITLWDDLISTDDETCNKTAVKTFKPDKDGFAEKIVYDQLNTLTGRLTVKSGPNILTLPKKYRNLIISSFKRGKILILDFSSLEVRVMLYEAGKNCSPNQDIYQYIADNTGFSSITRNIAKAVVISELYGCQKSTLVKITGLSENEVDKLVIKIREIFNVTSLINQVKQQYIDGSGCINNKYGRSIKVSNPLERLMLNHYVQSTGVDVSLLGFSKIAKFLAKKIPEVRPLFVLHDGLFLDVPEQHVEFVKNVRHVKVDGFEQIFPLKCEELN